jgi:hypothetical protein
VEESHTLVRLLHEQGYERAKLSVVFGSFQTNYSFSRFLTLSALLQIDTANAQAASANIRLRWNYRPDSNLSRFQSNCILKFGLFEQILLLNEEKLGRRIDEPLDQPWAGGPVDSDVFACDPFHIP